MSTVAVAVKEGILQLQESLGSTLNEFVFFSELTRFLKESLKEDHVVVFKVFPDQSVQLVSHNGESFQNNPRIKENGGLAAQVALTKRPYYSNSVTRDPIYNQQIYNYPINAELVIPMSIESTVVATLHLQSKKSDRNYLLDDIKGLQAILAEIRAPLVNLHMYLAVKNLNEVLLEKIKEREVETVAVQEFPFIRVVKGLEGKELFDSHPEFQKLHEMARKLAHNPLDALILGAPGTGKKTLARAVHYLSGRDDRPLVTLNVRLLVDHYMHQEQSINLEQVLVSAFKSAEKGTLIIEHIEDLPLVLQNQWADFMQLRESSSLIGKVRTLLISEPSLEEKVLRSQFDRAFFNTMHHVLVRLNPLVKRTPEELLSLANFYLEKSTKERSKKSFSPEATSLLLQYPWPGNLTELQKIVESAAMMSSEEMITPSHLPEMVHLHLEEVKKLKESEVFLTLEEVEKDYICATLKRMDGNKTQAAKSLGITVKTLYNKLHLYNMI